MYSSPELSPPPLSPEPEAESTHVSLTNPIRSTIQEPMPSIVSQPPIAPAAPKKKGAGSIIAALAVLFAKSKSLLAGLLPALKILKSVKIIAVAAKVIASSGTMLLSVVFYAQRWGYPFAIGFVLMIFIHECGHVFAAWWRGVKVSLPYFIPGMGALIMLKENGRSTWDEALIALGGPIAGTVGALMCWGIAEATDNPLMMAVAYTGLLINFFNLLPVMPLDGGRITGGISPRIWIVGLIGMAVLMYVGFLRNPMVIYIMLLSLPRAFRGIKSGSAAVVESGQVEATASQKWILAASYVGLCAVLLTTLMLTHR